MDKHNGLFASKTPFLTSSWLTPAGPLVYLECCLSQVAFLESAKWSRFRLSSDALITCITQVGVLCLPPTRPGFPDGKGYVLFISVPLCHADARK